MADEPATHEFGFYRDYEAIAREGDIWQNRGAFGYVHCSCGWKSTLLFSNTERVGAHRQHVADATELQWEWGVLPANGIMSEDPEDFYRDRDDAKWVADHWDRAVVVRRRPAGQWELAPDA